VSEEPLDLPRHPAVRVAVLPGKGRGIVAIEPIGEGELIEAAAVVRLEERHRLPDDHPLFDYAFAWDEPPFEEAIAFGILSLANHSEQPNAVVVRDYPNACLRLVALAGIAAGEEVTFRYGVEPWFEVAP
jgi:SET domain-containing protein